MSKLKFEDSMNEKVGLSPQRGTFTKRFLAFTGSAALVASGASVFVGTSAAYAGSTTPLPSATYQIGNGAVSGVSVSLSGSSSGATGLYTVSFVATNAIASGQTITVSSLGGVTAVTANSGTFGYTGAATVAATPMVSSVTPGQVTLAAPSAVPAGSTVTLTFTATNATVTSNTSSTPTVLVATSNPIAASAATAITIVAAPQPVTPLASASPTTPGATATLSLSIPQLTTATAPLTPDLPVDLPIGSTLAITVTGGAFTANPSDYTITDTTTGTSQTPTSAVHSGSGNNTVALTTSADIPAGDSISITAKNATNPSGPETPSIVVTQGGTSPAPVIVNDKPLTLTTGQATSNELFNSINYALLTSVSAVSFSASPTTVNASSSFVANFKATTAIASGSGNTVTVTLPAGSTVGTSAVVSDSNSTTPFSSSVTVTQGSTSNVAQVPVPSAIAAGDPVTVTLFGVTNAATVGSATATVATSADTNPVSGTFQLTASSTTNTVLPVVTPSNTGVGFSSNYTITNLSAAAAYAAGAASSTQQIQLYFPVSSSSGNTSFPTAPSQYTINDLTNTADSGPAASVTTIASANDPSGYAGVNLTVSKSIASGDLLTIVVNGVTNPSVASIDTMAFGGLNGTQAVATGFPSAAMSYPNGAFVQSAGQIDVVAGGFGFGIATPTVYTQLAAMDSSSVVSGSFPTAMAPRAGTLIQVVGTPGIWVVGTDGKIYQFSTMAQFLGDGYSPMQVVEVPSAGGLTVGTGVPPTAATTMADGSILNYSGTFYVYDGGQAFGISTPAEAATIEMATGSTVIAGSGSAPMSSAIADGSMLTAIGAAGVYVTSAGTAHQFSSPSQLSSAGYSFMYVVPVPSLGSLPTA